MVDPQVLKDGCSWILYDPDLFELPSELSFDPEYLAQNGHIDHPEGGRGSCYFFNNDQGDWVLRHYMRGGLVSRFLHDQYFGLSLEKSRSWSEWRLLWRLYKDGFPVPRPVAARVKRSCFYYRADLITEKIAESRTLADLIIHEGVPDHVLYSIGQVIRRFHTRGVWHPDLNAHNILLNQNDEVFLLDFDRSRVRREGHWKEQNLQRLKRSLTKVAQGRGLGAFENDSWHYLVSGYND